MSDRKHEHEIKNRYPNLYNDMFGNPGETCMSFGLAVGKGWLPLIEDLSEGLEKEIVEIKEEIDGDPYVRCGRCGATKRWHFLFLIMSSIKFFFLNKIKRIQVVWYYMKRNRKEKAWYKNRNKKMDKRLLIKPWRFAPHYKACSKFRLPLPRAAQIKEKFGGLRFYMTTYNDRIHKLIGEAETLSYKTCEWCGESGKLRDENRHWIKTLCDSCDIKDLERRKAK